MFGRGSKELEQAAPEEAEQSTDRIETPVSLGVAALPEQRGFQIHESGLLLPDGSAEVSVSGETLLTDSRRITLESVEADYHAEQERLNSPLEKPELDEAVRVIKEQMQQRAAEYEGDDETLRADINRDPAALRRVQNIINGERDMYVSDVTDPGETLSGSEMLGRVVERYAKLVPENFGPESHIGSMGGVVDIPQDGVIHCEGYNGSILYDFARAQQICQKLETMPKEVRTTITEAFGDADASWLYDEPVVVDRSLTKIESVT